MSTRRISSNLRRATSTVVLLALVLAQTLGAMHRIVHAPMAIHAAAAAVIAGVPATPSATVATGSQWLHALFSGHASEQGCELYDQLCHADGLPVAALPPVLAPQAPAWIAASISSAIRVRTFGVRARGPPLFA